MELNSANVIICFRCEVVYDLPAPAVCKYCKLDFGDDNEIEE